MYQLYVTPGFVVRLSDRAIIPMVEGNIDHAEFKAWVAKGNKPEDAPEAPGHVVPKVEAT